MAEGAGIVVQSWTPNNANNVVVTQVFNDPPTGINPYPNVYHTPYTIQVALGTTVVLYAQSDIVLNSVDGDWQTNIPGGGIRLNGTQPNDVYGQRSQFTFNTTGSFYAVCRFRQNVPAEFNRSNSAIIYISVIQPNTFGIGNTVTGYNTINSTFTTTGNAFENSRNLPSSITVATGNPIFFNIDGDPGPVILGTNGLDGFHGDFLTPGAPIIARYDNGSSPLGTGMLPVWARPGTTSLYSTAYTQDQVHRQSSVMNINVVWGLVDVYDMRFIFSQIEGWESLPVYNSKYANGNPVDTSTYIGWSAPIAAASLLDYLRRWHGVSTAPAFPDYIGKSNQYNFMSETWNTPVDYPAGIPSVFEGYGYPSWHRFTLDKFRPATNATIQSYDQTDFGWWMNTSNLGTTAAMGTGNPTYKGTTARGLYDGLSGFWKRAGHNNVVSAVLKNGNKTLGTLPPQYVAGAENNITAYEQMVVNRIDNDLPFIILVSGNPSVIPTPTTDPNTSWSKTADFDGTHFTHHVAINWAQPNMRFSIEIVAGYFTYYYTTASDTPGSVAQGIANALNSVNWSSLGYADPYGLPGPVVTVNGSTVDIKVDAFHGVNVNAIYTISGGPGGTPVGTITPSMLNSTVGVEGTLRNITAMQLTSANANWQTLNDNTSSPLTPIGGLGGNPDTATGNAYVVIGYCKPTPNPNLPSVAQNKFLLICRNTGGDRLENIYFALDQPLTSNPGDTSLWDRLIGSYMINLSYFTYVAPRTTLYANTNMQQVCAGTTKNIVPTMLIGGAFADNRFTHIYNGVGSTTVMDGQTFLDGLPPYTFTNAFLTYYTVQYQVSDGVSHQSGSYQIQVKASVSPQFKVEDTFGDLITGMPLPIAEDTVYTYTPTTPINAAFNYTWSVVRTNGTTDPSDFDFVSGTPTTKGPVQIRFNNTGQFTVSLTTTGSGSTSCPGQYSVPVKVDTVTLDFTYSTPAFLALPIQFNGLCNVAVSNWAWTFGDGGSESGVNSQNPVHTYNSIGPMTVVLTVMTLYGQFSVTKIVDIYPAAVVADFTYKPLTDIVVGETISFLDLSTPQPVPGVIIGEWAWTFGDGVTSNSQNPSHAFSAPGVYNVTLTYTIFFGPSFTLTRTGSVTKQITVQSGAPIVKSQTFIVSRNLINTFNFSDYTTSSNPITYSIIKQPTNGEIEQVNATTINYQPKTNYVGPDVLTFRATDNFDLFTNGNINLIVRPPVLTVIVGEVLNAAKQITIRLGTTDVNVLLQKDIVFQNTGTGDLLISNISIIEDVSNVFLLFDNSFGQVTSINNVLLKPRELFAFKVGIIASTAGTYTAKLQVDHN